MQTYETIVRSLLEKAEIEINGSNPWDIQVHKPVFYQKALRGSLSFGDSYVDHDWDCAQLDECINRILKANLDKTVRNNLKLFFEVICSKLVNLQSIARSRSSIHDHYDIGNDLYKAMLECWMYTCGYWKDATTLVQAQENKLRLIAEKLHFEPGMHVLDIGCGWGKAAEFFAKEYGVSVDGITISENQFSQAKQLCKGLPVRILFTDYRTMGNTKYDRIYSIGMFEHVGLKNHRLYMKIVDKHLKQDGLSLLHTISTTENHARTDPWINKRIFRDGLIPSEQHLQQSIKNIFVTADWHKFGHEYDRTLMAWHGNFMKHWPNLQKNYTERFRRTHQYYLLASAGSFRSGKNDLSQIVLSRQPLQNYVPVR